MFTPASQKKNNNKGFTLVELIIVVAIIAVLAAVLAPQYLQYVERARESNDLQVATSIMRATTAAVADPKNGVASGGTLMVVWNTVERLAGTNDPFEISVISAGSMNQAALQASIDEVMGTEPIEPQSKRGTTVPFIFELTIQNGTITLGPASPATVGWESFSSDEVFEAWGEDGIGVGYPQTPSTP